MTQPVPALPDQPPAAPATFDIKSKHDKFTAHFAWPEATATVFAGVGHNRKRLWSIPVWSPVAYLGETGPTLAIGHPGSNLLPPDSTQDTIVVSFYRDGKKLRDVRLGEVIAREALHEINGRLSWGVHYGFDDRGRYLIETQDGRTVALDPAGK